MTNSPGTRRPAGNLLILLGVGAALAALGLLIGFYSELPGMAKSALGDSAARAVTAAQSRGAAAVAAVTRNELGAGIFLALLVLTTGGLLLATASSRQVLAVAGATFTETRRGGALWLAVAGAVVVAAGAPFLDYQGGPPERLKMILSVGMGAATLMGMLLAVAVPALTFGRETDTRSIYAIVTKPVPRWAISGGKLLGVGLALAVALCLLGAGVATAARIAMAAEARRAANPEVVRLNLDFRKDRFPAPPLAADGAAARPRAVRLERGQSQSTVLDVPEGEGRGGWLLLRLHARPANPLMSAVRVELQCGDWKPEEPISALRDRPREVPVPSWAVRDGKLPVRIAPVADLQGNVYPVAMSSRGAVALAVAGDGLEATLAKALALLWFQLMVVAAVTLAAAGSMSFPVAVVVGAAAAVFGQLSGLAVGLLRQSVELGGREAAGGGPLAQLFRKLAAGELALLPDFEQNSAAEHLARGDFVPWSLLAGGALVLLLLRALPAALIGALAFSRREVAR